MNKETFKANIEMLTGETKQNKIADKLHVSTSKISKWFNGELSPTFADILNISEKYECSIDWLVGNELKSRGSSVYDVCKLIIELDTIAYMTFREESEPISCPFYNVQQNIMEYREVQREYISMHINNLPREIVREYERKEDDIDPNSVRSVIEESQLINDFIKKYTKLRKAYHEGYLDKSSFCHMTTVFLDELPRDQLHYFFNLKPEFSKEDFNF